MRSPVVLCAVLSLLPFPVAASPFADLICDDRARLQATLERRPHVTRQVQALRGPDAFLEVWVNDRTGDWTMVQAYANGTACIVAIGENWESVGRADPA